MNVADPTQVFLDVVSRRRSMRDFKSDPVPRELIESVFGTAQRAPSNCNTQPWFVMSSRVKRSSSSVRSCLPSLRRARSHWISLRRSIRGVYKERNMRRLQPCTIHWVFPRSKGRAQRLVYAQLQFFRRARGRVFHAAHRFWSA
ncbi:MAG: hypothetical protein CM15mP74_06760 [Halieaceae bacterium]|nr:MAG: hypothetical protein CM15mP74_06760 [Halieaceae bacterium]